MGKLPTQYFGTIFASFCILFLDMTYRIGFIISVLFFTLSIKAQKIRVLSASERSPIEHVAVFNNSRSSAAITDSQGWIDLSIFPEFDTIIFQHPSFVTVRLPKQGLINRNSVELIRKNILIDEYVISASKSMESKLIIFGFIGIRNPITLNKNNPN